MQKGLPDSFRRARVHAMRDHFDLEGIVWVQMDLLAPMVVEEMLAVEAHELADEPVVCVIGRCFDLENCGAEELGKIVKT